MPTQPDPQRFGKSNARLIEPPPTPVTLSERLIALSKEHHKASPWWANEVKKLVGPAQKLESKAWSIAYQGTAVGVVIGLILAWYIGKF